MADYKIRIFFGRAEDASPIPETLLDKLSTALEKEAEVKMEAVGGAIAEYKMATNTDDAVITIEADVDERKIQLSDGAIAYGENDEYAFNNAFEAACRDAGVPEKILDDTYGIDIEYDTFPDQDDIWDRAEKYQYGCYRAEMERRVAWSRGKEY